MIHDPRRPSTLASRTYPLIIRGPNACPLARADTRIGSPWVEASTSIVVVVETGSGEFLQLLLLLWSQQALDLVLRVETVFKHLLT